MTEAIQFGLVLIAVAALFVWVDRRALPRRRIVKFQYLPLVVCALWAFVGACLSAEEAVPSISGLATRAFSDHKFVIADLDGDGHPEFGIIGSVGFGPKGVEYRAKILLNDPDGDGCPEFVSVRSEGLGPQGLRYRIELQLTAKGKPQSFAVSAEPGGLRIIPRDLVVDGDLDLVVCSAEFLTPVSVWINHGPGKGAEADPAAYPRSISGEDSVLRSKTSHEVGPETLLRLSQISLDFPPGYHFRIEFTSDDMSIFPAAVKPPLGRFRINGEIHTRKAAPGRGSACCGFLAMAALDAEDQY